MPASIRRQECEQNRNKLREGELIFRYLLLETRGKEELIIGPGCVIVNTSEMKDKGKYIG